MKVRSVLKGVMIAVGVIFLLGIISTLFDWGGENVKPKQYDYKITYLRADTGEDILKDYSFMLKRNGNYPEGYSNDSAAFEISALAGTRTETDFGTIISEVYAPNDPETGYCFGGWYLDAACTQAFDGYVKRGAVRQTRQQRDFRLRRLRLSANVFSRFRRDSAHVRAGRHGNGSRVRCRSDRHIQRHDRAERQ